MPSHDLPAPARAIAAAIIGTVAAARAADPAAFAAEAEQLSRLDPEPVRVVLGAVVRSVLEERHPDGLAAEDLQDALEHCARSAWWFPDLDVAVLVVVLTGAFGMHDPEGEPRRLRPAEVSVHAALLLADVLTGTPIRLDHHLAAALAELARAETVEMP
jgi:hypothetical protein